MTARVVLPETPASYRPRDAAAMTRLSRQLIGAAIARGELHALRIGGCVVIPRECLQAWLDERAVPWAQRAGR